MWKPSNLFYFKFVFLSGSVWDSYGCRRNTVKIPAECAILPAPSVMREKSIDMIQISVKVRCTNLMHTLIQ